MTTQRFPQPAVQRLTYEQAIELAGSVHVPAIKDFTEDFANRTIIPRRDGSVVRMSDASLADYRYLNELQAIFVERKARELLDSFDPDGEPQ